MQAISLVISDFGLCVHTHTRRKDWDKIIKEHALLKVGIFYIWIVYLGCI